MKNDDIDCFCYLSPLHWFKCPKCDYMTIDDSLTQRCERCGEKMVLIDNGGKNE